MQNNVFEVKIIKFHSFNDNNFKVSPIIFTILILNNKDKKAYDPGIQAVTAQTRSQRSTKRETFLDRMWEVIKVKKITDEQALQRWSQNGQPHSDLRHSSAMVFREIDEVVCVEVDFKTS